MHRKSLKISVIRYVLFGVVALEICPGACGMSWTSPAATAGSPVSQEVAEYMGWPAGTMALVNDSLRGDGWTPCFSEWPNDMDLFEMRVKDSKDVQHLIDLLAKVDGSPVYIFLDPGSEPRGLGFTTTLPEGNAIGVVFSIGSQKQIDQWYGHLDEVEPGVRKFGVHRYEQPPVARPPTLTLYVGNDAVDLATLTIPAKVKIRAGYNDRYRNEHKDDKVVQEIEKLVKEHKAKREAALVKERMEAAEEETQ